MALSKEAAPDAQLGGDGSKWLASRAISSTMCTFDKRALCADGSLPPQQESSRSNGSFIRDTLKEWGEDQGPLDPPPRHPLAINPNTRMPPARGSEYNLDVDYNVSDTLAALK